LNWLIFIIHWSGAIYVPDGIDTKLCYRQAKASRFDTRPLAFY
jgi:hypothetical protein